MGCFNISCGLTSLSIQPGEKVRFIILRKSSLMSSPGSILYSGDNREFFYPVSTPILGIMDDYGRAKHIDYTSKLRDMIENFFDVNLECIIEYICECSKTPIKGIKNEKILNDLWGMYIIDKAYEEILDKPVDDINKIVRNPKLSDIQLTSLINKSYADIEPWFDYAIIKDDEVRKELENFYMFGRVFRELNKLYLPSFLGTQHGNNYMEKKLVKIMKGLVKRG